MRGGVLCFLFWFLLDLLTCLVQKLRHACVAYIYGIYAGTDTTTLEAGGREASWEDWREKMSGLTYWADELCIEAVLFLFGGPIHILSGRCLDAVVNITERTHGNGTNSLLQLGCALDRHFYSFHDALLNI